MVRLRLPTPLHSYTGGESEVEAEGATLAALLVDLDARYPGLRFRIVDETGALREHIRIFLNGAMVKGLERAVAAGDDVFVMAALSGG